MSIPTEPLETAWEGKWVTVHRQGKWEYAARARGIRAAVIVAIDDEDNVLLVGQYRVPMQRWSLELPAGLIGDEQERDTALDAARRELMEETGYSCAAVEELGEFHRVRREVAVGTELGRAQPALDHLPQHAIAPHEVAPARRPIDAPRDRRARYPLQEI